MNEETRLDFAKALLQRKLDDAKWWRSQAKGDAQRYWDGKVAAILELVTDPVFAVPLEIDSEATR